MNRTSAIVATAVALALVAILVARGQDATRPDPLPPPPPGPNSITTGQVSLAALPSERFVKNGGSGELFLDISLAGLAKRRAKQLPINLALVIDRSGSMAGAKLEHAREAARQLVSRLRQNDRISIVTYGSDVTVLVPSTPIDGDSRARVLAAIETIVDRGGTYLSGGLESGRQEVLRHGREGMVNRVVLISDGQANEGIVAPAELSRLARQSLDAGVHVTAMGVGLDFNENVMTAIAEHGGGHYYFIQDSSSMASIFSKELETLLATVAKSARLKLALEPGVELLDIFGYTYSREGAPRQVSIDLPDLYGGQHRKLICKLRVPANREGKLALARVELSFTDAETGAKETAAATASVTITSDPRQVEEGRDRNVLARAEQAQAAKNLGAAMEAYGRGDVARAQTILADQIRATEGANASLKNRDLDALVGKMRVRMRGAASAAPSSPAGRSLVKEGKFEAYQLAK
jgi:Ca-activated chloride channel family protein